MGIRVNNYYKKNNKSFKRNNKINKILINVKNKITLSSYIGHYKNNKNLSSHQVVIKGTVKMIIIIITIMIKIINIKTI